MNTETIIKSLQRKNFEIHPLTTNKCILAYKGTTSLVCTVDDEIMVSISFNGSPHFVKPAADFCTLNSRKRTSYVQDSACGGVVFGC